MILNDLRAANDIEQLRDEWIALIAHDLRQPLTIISAYAVMIERMASELPEPVPEWSQHIIKAAERLKRMTRDLLDTSSLSANRLRLNRTEVDPALLVDEIVRRVSPIVQGHRIRLSIREPIPVIQADPDRIEQILGNLISNASKFGYPESEIRVSVIRQEGGVRISVQNRGDGITMEDQAMLFGRFSRLRHPRDGKVEGLGLGLHIARGLVEAHGGRIWVKSILHQTTTFHFTLPPPRAS